MTDLQYFQGLYATALDFTMKAHWGARVRELNGGHLGECRHTEVLPFFDRSYGCSYYWEVCEGCGKEINHKALGD